MISELNYRSMFALASLWGGTGTLGLGEHYKRTNYPDKAIFIPYLSFVIGSKYNTKFGNYLGNNADGMVLMGCCYRLQGTNCAYIFI